VTAGLDGALVVASLLHGDHIAEVIQLAIEYAPEPVFHSGTPDTASPEVLSAFWESYGNVKVSRETDARRFATAFGIAAP
jgi:cyclohexyl-isocyanide hydratase